MGESSLRLVFYDKKQVKQVVGAVYRNPVLGCEVKG